MWEEQERAARKRLVNLTIRAHHRFTRRDNVSRSHNASDRDIELAVQAFRTYKQLGRAWKRVGL